MISTFQIPAEDIRRSTQAAICIQTQMRGFIIRKKTFIANSQGRKQALTQIHTRKMPCALDTWIRTHTNAEEKVDWVAHAVWSKSEIGETPFHFTRVLRSGSVMPAEQVLRSQKIVEYEVGSMYGGRGCDQLPTLAKETISLLDTAMKHAEEDGYPFTVRLIKNDVAKDDTEAFMKLFRQHLYGDDKLELPNDQIRCFAPFACHYSFQFSKGELTFAYQYLRDKFPASKPELVMIAYDESRKERGLQTIDEYLIGKAEEKFPAKMLYTARTSYLRTIVSKLNPEIRVVLGGINWDYGAVAVLTGNAAKKISDFNSGEKFLLAPFQNKGAFFQIELDDPDTIVIGPKMWQKELSVEIARSKARYFAIEDMARRHLEYFQIPIWRKNFKQ